MNSVPYNHCILVAQHLIFQRTLQPNLVSRIFNRDRTMGPKEREFIQQWNTLRRLVPSAAATLELASSSSSSTIQPQPSPNPSQNVSISNQSHNNLKSHSSPHINHERHPKHRPHTQFYANRTFRQLAENYIPQYQQHIHVPFVPNTAYINGISQLNLRYADVFDGTEWGRIDSNNDQEIAVTTTTPIISPSQLVDYIRTNLNHDVQMMNYINLHGFNITSGQLTTLTNQQLVNDYYQSQVSMPWWLKTLATVAGAGAIGLGAFGAYKYWLGNLEQQHQQEQPLE